MSLKNLSYQTFRYYPKYRLNLSYHLFHYYLMFRYCLTNRYCHHLPVLPFQTV
jgi:hypothetical protein